MHALHDTQMNTNVAISHIDEFVKGTESSVNSASEEIADLWRAKVSVNCLEEQQADLSTHMNHVNGTVSSLKLQFGSLIDDVKAHFETASHIVGRTSADQIDLMRTRYQEDIGRSDILRDEIEEFVRRQTAGFESMTCELASAQESAAATGVTLSGSIDNLERQREKDLKNAELEFAQLRKLSRDLKATVEGEAGTGGTGCEISSDTFSSFVESAWIGLACEMQTETDRQSIGLYGFKPAGQSGLPDINAKKNSSLQSPLSSPRRNRGRGGDSGQCPIVSIDDRCLSCSGSTATAMAGFKMACLQFHPGQVEYEGAMYSRSELVSMQMELLHQVRSSLQA